VLIHEYVALDMNRGIEALDNLVPVRRFVAIVAKMEQRGGNGAL
jgi:hypothetical protein